MRPDETADPLDPFGPSDIAEFDHHSEHYAEHAAEWGQRLRACPVGRSDKHGGFWIVSRYEDVERVLKDDATFSSQHLDAPDPHGGVTIPSAPVRQVPIEMDPPEYLPYRQLLNPWFSPAASRRWEPRLRAITGAFLNRICPKGEGDLVLDISNPVPAVFTAMLLGLPTEDWRFYSDPMHAMIYTRAGSPEHDAALVGYMECLGKVMEVAAARLNNPLDDLLSMLVHADIDGQRLTQQEVLEIASLVLVGGVDTTTSVLANALSWLELHPQERAWLAEDPSRIRVATEEFLRYFTPTQALARTVTRDVELAGVQLRAGDRVLMSFAAANRDDAQFESPDEMQLRRETNRHQAFGLGIHRCLGSTFARLEVQVVLEEVLRRCPDYRIDRDHARRYPNIGIVNGWVNLPVAFSASEPEPNELSF